MPKSKAQLMKETRQRRKDRGLVEFRAWVTPAEKQAIKLALKDIRANAAYGNVLAAVDVS